LDAPVGGRADHADARFLWRRQGPAGRTEPSGPLSSARSAAVLPTMSSQPIECSAADPQVPGHVDLRTSAPVITASVEAAGILSACGRDGTAHTGTATPLLLCNRTAPHRNGPARVDGAP